MKLVKNASGKPTIRMNREEWERIGSENGWINKEAKWSGDTEIKQTGEWAGKSIAELEKTLSSYKKKQESYKEKHDGKANEEYTEKMRQINFAIRSKKKKDKWGDVK